MMGYCMLNSWVILFMVSIKYLVASIKTTSYYKYIIKYGLQSCYMIRATCYVTRMSMTKINLRTVPNIQPLAQAFQR